MASNGGGGARASRRQLIRLNLKLPYTDLALSDKTGGPAELNDDEAIWVLALPYGIGPNEPRLLAVDDAGRLILSPTGGNQAGVFLVDDPAVSNGKGRIFNDQDATGSAPSLLVQARQSTWNGANWDRVRSASAAALAAQSGLGAVLSAPPGMWTAVSNPAAGVVASATRAAGGAGVRHVCSAILATFGAIAAPVATALTWALRDGVSGAGTILAQGQVAVPAAPFQGQPIFLSDLAIPGTAATAMTLEFSAALANLLEGVTLFGFDAS